MHGFRGNGARETTALMPIPLQRSTCGFTTPDSHRGYGHGHSWEEAWGLSPSLRPWGACTFRRILVVALNP